MGPRLPALGADVVDLAQAARSPYVARRFAARVLSSRERARLGEADGAERGLWRYWAAKEAAFKLGCRLDPRMRFDHARFEVEGEGARGVVRHPELEAEVRWTEGEGWIHAVAFEAEPAAWLAAVEAMEPLAREVGSLAPVELASAPHHDSRAARVLAHRLLAALGAPFDIALIRTAGPTAVSGLDGAPLGDQAARSWGVSLSHDGRFVSAAVATSLQSEDTWSG